MKKCAMVGLVLVWAASAGCYWISGPWVGRDKIQERYDEIEVGMLQEEVEDELGEASEAKYVTDQSGRIPEGSEEAWLLYKYDYPDDPLLITIKVDQFGIVTEKHFDDMETVAELAGRRKTEEEKATYPGAAQRRIQELLKKRHQGE